MTALRGQPSAALFRGALKGVGVISNDSLNRKENNDEHQRRQIEPAHLRQSIANGPVNWLEEITQSIPDLRNQRLVQIEHLKVDQPTHDDVNDDNPPKDIGDEEKDLKQRKHMQGRPERFPVTLN